MEEKRFIELIRSKLSGHKLPVDGDVWDKISRSLPVTPIAWYRRRGVRMAVAAVALLAVTVAGVLCRYDFGADVPQGDEAVLPIAQEQGPVTEPAAVAEPAVPAVEEQPCAAPRTLFKTARAKNLYCANKPTAEPLLAETPAVSVTDAPAVEPAVCDADSVMPAVVVEDSAEAEIWLAQGVGGKSFYDDRVVEDIKKCMCRKQQPLYSFSFEAGTSLSRSVSHPLHTRAAETMIKLAHKMPLNTRVLIERHLGKWSIGSGLSYSYLTADYEVDSRRRYGQQDMHYIGLPIFASYRLARVQDFKFYFTLGGQVDINTAAYYREDPASPLYPYVDKMGSFRDKHLQFSTQVRLGASYSLSDHWALYFEPVLSYYFDNNSLMRALWDDVPLNVSMSIGVKTSF